MICKFCGNVIEDNSDYCFICGQKVVNEAPAYAAEVYSQQPQGAPAQPVYSAAPVAPEQPVYAAPAQPVYTAPVAPVVAEGKKRGGKAKKAKKAKAPANPAALSKGAKILTGVLAAIFPALAAIMCQKTIILAVCLVLAAAVAFVYYKNYQKAMDGGYEEKALDILNIGMIGLCVGMGIAVLVLIKTFMLA